MDHHLYFQSIPSSQPLDLWPSNLTVLKCTILFYFSPTIQSIQISVGIHGIYFLGFFLIKFWWWWWRGWFWWFESRPHGLSHTVRDIRVGAWVYVCVWRFYPMHSFFFPFAPCSRAHLMVCAHQIGTLYMQREMVGLHIPWGPGGPVRFANILHQFTRICIYSPAALSMWAPLWGHTNSWGRWRPNDIGETNLCAKFELH